MINKKFLAISLIAVTTVTILTGCVPSSPTNSDYVSPLSTLTPMPTTTPSPFDTTKTIATVKDSWEKATGNKPFPETVNPKFPTLDPKNKQETIWEKNYPAEKLNTFLGTLRTTAGITEFPETDTSTIGDLTIYKFDQGDTVLVITVNPVRNNPADLSSGVTTFELFVKP